MNITWHRTIQLAALGLLATEAHAATSPAAGETIVVNTNSEVVDFGGSQTVSDLPGPDGETSFAEAVTAANNTPGPQTIAFQIPTSKWFLSTEFAYVRVGSGPLVITDGQLTVDGTTQTAFTGNTNPDGAEVAFFNTEPNSAQAPVMQVLSDGNLFQGLGEVDKRGSLLLIDGDGNRVVNCQIHGPLTAAIELRGNDNVIGGTAAGEGNELSGLLNGVRFSAPASGNQVIGNPLIRGTDYGIHLFDGADGNVIGGPTPAARNVISGSGHTGEQFVPFGGQILVESDSNRIEGNAIGSDSTGTQVVQAAGWFGVQIKSGSDNQFLRNVIVGHTGVNHTHYGVYVTDASHGNVFAGNAIGTDLGGSISLPNEFGLFFGQSSGISASPDDNLVGGAAPDQGNVIAYNQRDGILVFPTTTGIAIRGNSFHDNGHLGIDLSGNEPVAYPDNVNTNDPADGDGGGNGLQNHPTITSVIDNGSTTIVSGALDTPQADTTIVELFTCAQADPSNFGEGEVLVGSVVPDAGGSFSAVLPGGLGGQVFVATATDAGGNTSEFSPAFGAPGDISVYCTAQVTSQGCRPEIVSLGTPSASAASGFEVRASLVVNGVNGMLFYGKAGSAAVPLLGGILCVQPPVTRTGVQGSAGTFNCAGTFAFDFNAYVASGADPALVTGQRVWCQFWSRDVQAPAGSNLTDALTFVLEP